jgi:AcrR family transcriptional regulator
MPESPARTGTLVRPGRPRQADLDQRLESAVLTLLHDLGPGSVTVEGVAEKSGVAKTSIYRRHANRSELLTAVLSNAIGVPQVPRDGTVRDKIRFALEQAWRQMGDVLGPGGLAAIVGNSDPFRAALRPYEETLVKRIEADSDAGLLRPGLDADGIVSLMIGAYLGELVRNGRVARDWLDRSMEMLWAFMANPS